MTQELPDDVRRLVIAARVVAFEDQGRDAIKELDAASEAFADRVPWQDEPEIPLAESKTDEKPLFIPLRTEWFRKFEDGSKDTEYRAYGPRWNERTCRVGRAATISHGYSGKRMSRKVTGFKALTWAEAPEVARTIYPDAAFIAAIELRG